MRRVLTLSVLLLPRVAAAQSTIKAPGDRPSYVLELEPHASLGLFDPPGRWAGGDGLGAGGRAAFEIVDVGFVPTINDSVAIGVGADIVHYAGGGGDPRGTCSRYAAGPAGTNVCVEIARAGGASTYVFVPVVMQWNFWLARRWSVFGEPGLSVYWSDVGGAGVAPVVDVGGRFHVTERVTLTLRLGYPVVTLGVSFLL